MSNIINTTQGIIDGVQKVNALLRPTYGGAGTNVIVESHLRPGHIVTNDCETIVQSLKFDDPSEKRGLAFIQELSARTDRMSGDNRKTTCILMEEILVEGSKIEMNKIQLKKELDELIPFIESEIDKQTKFITVDEVASVATTASENEETGKLLQEIYQKIGADGIIHVEGSGTYETSYTFTDGVKFDRAGMLSPFMVYDEQAKEDKIKETRAVYKDPVILVTRKKITTDEDINPLLNQMEMEGKKDLVIFTNDMDSGVASMLVGLHKSGRFHICIIKAPSVWQEYYFEDFALCAGATIVEDASGLNLRSLPFEVLGTCDIIEVYEEETVIIGPKDISEHIKMLTARGDTDSKLRLSWLANKTVKLKLGSNSETDLSYKRLKTNDAVRSSQLALKYGIVPGGGITLLNVSKTLPETTSGDILRVALENPIRQIIKNAGTFDIMIGEMIQRPMSTIGFDAKNLKEIDMFDAGIVDSAQTIKTAIRNAIGIASTILTAGGLTYIPKLSAEEMSYNMAMQKNYDF